MEIYYFDPYFWKVITCLKTKNTFLMCKQHLHNCHMIAMGTMTCQDCRYFGFKVILPPIFITQNRFLAMILLTLQVDITRCDYMKIGIQIISIVQ